MSDNNQNEAVTSIVLTRDSSAWNRYDSKSSTLSGLLSELNVDNAAVSLNGDLHTNYDTPIGHGDEVVIISRNKSGG